MGEEANINTNATTETGTPAETQQKDNMSTEDRLAELLAENKRLKRASDKATSEAASYKKQLMDSKSESERAAMEKAERDAAMREELETLRKESAINKYAKSFVALGYSEKQAMLAAEAQYTGDTDTLFHIQQEHQTEYEKRIKADLMKSMPVPSIGNDDGITITQKQFDEMDYMDRVKLFNEHPDVYAKLANN